MCQYFTIATDATPWSSQPQAASRSCFLPRLPHLLFVCARLQPYEGGKFLLDVRIPPEYPFKPPVVAFKTRVYHPNIDMKLEGAVGLSLLYEDWSPTHTIVTILQSLHDLLRNPNPGSSAIPRPMNASSVPRAKAFLH